MSIKFVFILSNFSQNYSGKLSTTAREIIKVDGIKGLYRGGKACVLREMTFSPIFFLTYQMLKKHFENPDGTVSSGNILMSGFIAGVPASV